MDFANLQFPGNLVASTIPLSPVRCDSWMGLAVVPEFSSSELADTVNRFKSRDRALGPNGITSRIWGVVYDTWPSMVESAFNVYLRTGTFLECWKRANRALLSNPGKPGVCLLRIDLPVFVPAIPSRRHQEDFRIPFSKAYWGPHNFLRSLAGQKPVWFPEEPFDRRYDTAAGRAIRKRVHRSWLGGCHWAGHPQHLQLHQLRGDPRGTRALVLQEMFALRLGV